MCRCSDKLLPGCTKRFCPPTSEDSKEPQGTSNRNNAGGGGGGVVNFPGAVRATRDEGVCVDNAGVTRVPGESWKEQCNTCQCDSDGNALCTEIFCNNDDDAVEVCTDSQGKSRIPGESWNEDCNTCRCVSTGVCVVKDSVSTSSPEISICSLRTPAKTRAASLNVTKKVWRTVELSPSTITS